MRWGRTDGEGAKGKEGDAGKVAGSETVLTLPSPVAHQIYIVTQHAICLEQVGPEFLGKTMKGLGHVSGWHVQILA